jgi:hypothetical protein
MQAVHPEQGLQALAPHILDDRHHLTLNRRTSDVVQQIDHAELLQEGEEIIQQGPSVQPVDPVADLLPVQAPRHPRVVAPGDLPTQPFGQVVIDLSSCLSPRLLPSVMCSSAIEESGPQIKTCAYLISEFQIFLAYY